MLRVALALITFSISGSAEAQAPSGFEQVASVLRDEARIPAAVLGDLMIVIYADLPSEARRPAELIDALTQVAAEALRARPGVRSVEVSRSDPVPSVVSLGARGSETVLVLDLSIEGNHLELSGSWYDAGRGWRAAIMPYAEIIGSFSLRVPFDAHLRSFLRPLPRLTADDVSVASASLPGRGYVLSAAGDLDGDGRDELILATSDRVDVLRVSLDSIATRSQVIRLARLPLPDLPLPPMRTPRHFGTALSSDSGIVVQLSHLQPSLEVRVTGSRFEAVEIPRICPDGFPLDDACASLVPGRDYLAAALEPRGSLAASASAPAAFYERQVREVLQPSGERHRYEVVVTPRGRVISRGPNGLSAVTGYGLGLNLADLDQDGQPEVITSSASLVGSSEGDRLHLLRVRRSGAVIALWTSEPLRGSAITATSADLDGDGRREFVVIEELPGEDARSVVWVVR